jgi:hypothetical protein
MTAPYDRVRERYQHDQAFAATVDCLQGIVLNLHLTPSELREAAMLACILVEERYPRPTRIRVPQCQQCGASVFPLRIGAPGFALAACGHELPKDLPLIPIED